MLLEASMSSTNNMPRAHPQSEPVTEPEPVTE